jgi:hypothetical protein
MAFMRHREAKKNRLNLKMSLGAFEFFLFKAELALAQFETEAELENSRYFKAAYGKVERLQNALSSLRIDHLATDHRRTLDRAEDLLRLNHLFVARLLRALYGDGKFPSLQWFFPSPPPKRGEVDELLRITEQLVMGHNTTTGLRFFVSEWGVEVTSDGRVIGESNEAN